MCASRRGEFRAPSGPTPRPRPLAFCCTLLHFDPAPGPNGSRLLRPGLTTVLLAGPAPIAPLARYPRPRRHGVTVGWMRHSHTLRSCIIFARVGQLHCWLRFVGNRPPGQHGTPFALRLGAGDRPRWSAGALTQSSKRDWSSEPRCGLAGSNPRAPAGARLRVRLTRPLAGR